MTRPTAELEDLMLTAAELYYYEGQTQAQVAAQLGCTRWTVGRLLDDARRSGVVRVVIDHPRARRHELELRLKAAFGLRDVVVVSAQPSPAATLTAVAQAAARHLAAVRPAPRRMAVSWGRTVAAVAAELAQGWTRGLEVVQTNGGPTLARGNPVGDSLHALAEKGGGTVRGLAAPTIVESARLADLLRQDAAGAGTLRAAQACRSMLYSPGTAEPDSVLVESGYVSLQRMEQLRQAGAVGDVMSHFISADGQLVDPELDARTLSIDLDLVRRCPAVLAVASGAAKQAATVAAVKAGLCTGLITDSAIAAALWAARPPDQPATDLADPPSSERPR
ncbi:MAG: TetR family transcriptional regulator [Propionibacteriaceae bacterium]|jgi:deoxyribonucleoside regulator|nr:TetR family transcriptional regulator [Propionibacteriaceae bacterium]